MGQTVQQSTVADVFIKLKSIIGFGENWYEIRERIICAIGHRRRAIGSLGPFLNSEYVHLAYATAILRTYVNFEQTSSTQPPM